MDLNEWMNQLKEFLSTDVGFYSLLAFLVVVLVLFSFVLVKSTKKSKFRKMIHKMEKSFSTFSQLPIKEKLEKIEIIGKDNIVYSQIYSEYSMKYLEVTSGIGSEIIRQIEEAKKEFALKKYRKVEEIIRNCDVSLIAFQDELQIILSHLNEITKEESSSLEMSKNIKESFNECKDLYLKNMQDFPLMKNEFEEKFSDLNMRFEIYNEYLKNGNFTETREIMAMIDQEVTELKKHLQIMPRLVSITMTLIPKKINEIMEVYNDMLSNDYPLHHVSANNIFASIKEMMRNIIANFKTFHYENTEKMIEAVEEKLNELKNKLREEVTAREVFDQKCGVAYEKAEKLERTYVTYIQDIEKHSEIYAKDDQVELSIQEIKTSINRLSVVKRELDTLNYNRQPFSIRIDKVVALEKAVIMVEESIDAYRQMLIPKRDVSEKAYELVNEGKKIVQNYELKIKSYHIQKFTDKYLAKIEKTYNLIEILKSFLVRPIDDKKVSRYVKDINELILDIENNSKLDFQLLKESEKLIVFANRYRNDFSEVARNLSRAEIFFKNADFSSAKEITLEAVNRFINVAQ